MRWGPLPTGQPGRNVPRGASNTIPARTEAAGERRQPRQSRAQPGQQTAAAKPGLQAPTSLGGSGVRGAVTEMLTEPV